jgi:serine-type D-Ala-D-Ala carboxypeptidase (penicillin-binding protein 5/6)
MTKLMLRLGLLIICACATLAHAEVASFRPAATAALVKIGDKVVWEQEADQRLPQASLTKIMTALLVLERYKPDAIVTISPEAAAAHPTKIGLRAGDRMRLSDLLAASLVHSANDACRALADWHSGSEQKFVERMNQRARELGLTDTHFANACGFDAEGHYSTANDLAKLAEVALKYRTFSRLVNKPQMVVRTVDGRRKFAFRTTNALIGHYDGAMGVKTGFTFKAGPCLVAVSKRNNTRVMIVLLNARNRWPNAKQMFDVAFAQAPKMLRQQSVAVSSETRTATTQSSPL